MDATYIVTVSDPHCGHRHGLMNPDTSLEQVDADGIPFEYHPPLTKIQEYLWDCFTRDVEEVRKIANGNRIVVLPTGDLTTGDKHKDELVSDRPADQIIIAKATMQYMMGLPGMAAMRIVKGTGAHNFGFGTSEILIAEFLKEEYASVSTMVADHYLLHINGMTVDAAHHGPTGGSRNWLKGNEARYYLRSLMMDEFMAGRIPPRLILRGHYHEYIREELTIKHEGKWYTSTIIISPSYT